jgi:hypothetical protein
MGLLNNIDQHGLNDLLIEMDRFQGLKYLSDVDSTVQLALCSDNGQRKAKLCFQALAAWWSSNDVDKYSQSETLLATENNYRLYIDSQRTLCSFRKRFNQLVIKSLDPSTQKKIGRKVAEIWQFVTGISLSKRQNRVLGESMLKLHTADPLCFIGLACATHLEPLPYREAFIPPISILTKIDSLDSSLIAALYATIQQIPLASNCWHYHQPEIPLTAPSPQKICNASLRLAERRARASTQCLWVDSPFISTRLRGKNARGSLVGNCHERAAHLFNELIKERRVDWKIDLCVLRGGDHAFILIRNALLRWYLLEAWNGAKIYPSDQIPAHLQNYCGVGQDGTPTLSPFDPKSHQIYVLTSNFYSRQEFEKRSTMPLFTIASLLEDFHALPPTERDAKMQRASTLISTIQALPFLKTSLLYNLALQELLEQMLYLTKKERIVVVKQKVCPINPINAALDNGDLETLKRHLKADEKADAQTLIYAMDAASRTQNMAFLRLIVEKDVKVRPCELLWHNQEGGGCAENAYLIALALAIDSGSAEFLRLAVHAGARASTAAFQQAFSYAQHSPNTALLRRVIEHKAPPHQSAFQDALTFALKKNKNELLRIVSAAGAQPHPQAFQEAFDYAVKTGHYEPLRIVSAAGAPPHPEAFRNAFHHALAGSYELLRITLAAGAVPYPEAFGKALDCALATGRYEILRMIAAAGGQPDFEAYDKAFSFALRTGSREPLRIITDILENR